MKAGYWNIDKSQQRETQIIWFNHPNSTNVTTKVDKFYLGLIDKNIPPLHKLNKLFNQNNVKTSYSYLTNIKPMINAHSKKKKLYPSPTVGRRICNCISVPQCLLNQKNPKKQKFLSNNILYQTNITLISENSEIKVYQGISDTTFKLQYANPKK